MKVKIVFFILIFCSELLVSQIKSKNNFFGKVFLDSIQIDNVHIINRTTQKGTITNSKGTFELSVKVGDTLFISHINADKKELIIALENLNRKNVEIYLKSKTYTLHEVALGSKKSIFYVDKDIITNEKLYQPKLNLPYASTKSVSTVDDFDVKLNQGVSFNFDAVLNRVSGAYQRREKIKEIKKQDAILQAIREKFSDFFFINQLMIKKEYITSFLEFCLPKNIRTLYELKDDLKLTALLINESKRFLHTNVDTDSLLTKVD